MERASERRMVGDAVNVRGLAVAVVGVAFVIGALVAVAVTAPSAATLPEGRAGQQVVDGNASPDPVSDPVRQPRLPVEGPQVSESDVTVGVLDVTGFDVDHPAIADAVVEGRAFAEAEGIENHGRDRHGTAAASVVARVAPDAQLYLASFDTADDFERAVVWLVREDVDVVVAPVSFYGRPGDGSARTARVVEWATQQGVVFVAPAGNLGTGHWQGRFDPDATGAHRFRNGTRNYLQPTGTSTVRLWLSWSGTTTGDDIALELYRVEDGDDPLVAQSQPFRADAIPNERIVATVEPGARYYFEISGSRSALGTTVEVSSPTHGFTYRRRGRSVVAPGTADAAVTVGAYDRRADRVAPYSSSGPVGNRSGVDVVAPGRVAAAKSPNGFVGSSAAAPYTAGVAALVLAANPTLTPAEVEGLLRKTARDVGPPGVDPVGGAGLVVPGAAVANATTGEPGRDGP